MTQWFVGCFQFVCLVIFLFVFMGRTLYLRVHRNIRVFTLGVAKRGFQHIVELSFFIMLTVWSVEVFLYTLPGGIHLLPAQFTWILHDSAPVKLAGAALNVVGLGIFILALLAFGDSWRVGIDRQSPGQLVTGGVFAVTRNPIFLFLDLYLIGTFFINGTIGFLIFAVLIAAGLHYQILQKEKFLSRAYGKVYQDYCARTKRYFGRRLDQENTRT